MASFFKMLKMPGQKYGLLMHLTCISQKETRSDLLDSTFLLEKCERLRASRFTFYIRLHILRGTRSIKHFLCTMSIAHFICAHFICAHFVCARFICDSVLALDCALAVHIFHLTSSTPTLVFNTHCLRSTVTTI